ncbi:SGNH/GDSL hydrolase family protein [Acinetobacter sp. AGC35]
MADQVLTKQKLINADEDIGDLEEVLNGPPGKLIKTRLGREVYTLASVPQINTMTREEVTAAVAPKANKADVDSALSNLSTTANKYYPTLDAANADIANIALNQSVTIGEEVNSGLWEKKTTDATSLTKSPYDPLTQAKSYTDAAVNELGISSNENSDISIAIVDKNDKRTWLEADASGKPTNYSKSLILDKIDPEVSSKIQAAVAEVGIEQIASSDLSVAIVDSQDRRTWLEADASGKLTQYSAKCIKDAINLASYASPSKFKSSYQSTEIKTVSGPDIVCWGDSMTQGAGATGGNAPYPQALQLLLNNAGISATVRNSGCGGETSFTIAARQGGNPMRLYAESGVIPASPTAVKIVMLDNNGKPIRPLVQKSGIPGQDSSLWFDGAIAGIKGRLAIVKPNGASSAWDNANYYTFTRAEAGAEVILNRPTPFYLDFAEARRGDIAIIWTGQNNETPSEYIIADNNAMINHLNTAIKRYLVISRPKPYLDLAAQISDEEKLYLAYGSRFINVRKYLIEYGLADAGITPTAQDTADIAAGLVPSSLRSDGTHFNNAGYAVVAKIVFERLKQLGWV